VSERAVVADGGLMAELAGARERLLRAIQGVSEQQLKRRPEGGLGEEAWSMTEVLGHLLASHNLWAGRLRLALTEDGAEVEPSPPEAHERGARSGRSAPVPQLIHGLLASRREIEMLHAAIESKPGGLARSVSHPVRGRLTCEWILREKVVAHEAEHAAQLKRLRELTELGGVGR
jgi:hypothetical protein